MSCLSAIFVFVFAMFSVSASAVDIDGYAGNDEWSVSKFYNLEDQYKFINGVKNAQVNIYFDNRTNGLYLLLRCELKSVTDTSRAKLCFSVNGSDDTLINFSNEVLDSPFETETAVKVYADSGFVIVETLCYITEGLDLPAEIRLKITDCDEKESNVYTLEFDNREEQSDEDFNSKDSSQTKKERTVKSKSAGKAAKSAGKAAKSKTGRTTTSFPFKKAEKSSSEDISKTDSDFEAETESADKSKDYITFVSEEDDNNYSARLPIIIVGVVCALAVVGAAVYSGIKGNKINQDDDKKQK